MKTTRRNYNAVIAAKNIIFDLCEDGKLDSIESIIEIARNTALMKAPAIMKIALLTVLTSGTASDNGFMMPATAACCENFKITAKQMKRHSLSLLVYDPIDARAETDGTWEGYFDLPLFNRPIFISAKRVGGITICRINQKGSGGRYQSSPDHISGTWKPVSGQYYRFRHILCIK